MSKFEALFFIWLIIVLVTAVNAYLDETFDFFKETHIQAYLDETNNFVKETTSNAYQNVTFFYLDNETTAMTYLKETFTDHPLVCGLVAGTAAVGAVGPVVLVGLGFTKAGVTLGSIGATLMSYGFPTTALQSAGAAGISFKTTLAGGAVGAAAAQWIATSLECSPCG